MSRQVELACTVCTEDFQVPIGEYHAHDGILPCPCCGSTDLFLLGEREVPLTAPSAGMCGVAAEGEAP